MHAIEVTTGFSASHQLRLADGSLEPRHRHAWRIHVQIAAERLDALDTVLDFHAVQRALEAIVTPWRGQHLNEVAPFATAWARQINPSAERVAEQIAGALTAAVDALDGAVRGPRDGGARDGGGGLRGHLAGLSGACGAAVAGRGRRRRKGRPAQYRTFGSCQPARCQSSREKNPRTILHATWSGNRIRPVKTRRLWASRAFLRDKKRPQKQPAEGTFCLKKLKARLR